MKILILSDGIPPFVMGGMQRHTFNLVKFLVKSGVHVKLVHCNHFGEPNLSHEEVVKTIFEKESIDGFESVMIEFPKAGKIPGHYIRRSYAYSKKVFDLVKGEINQFDFVYIKGFSGWRLLERKNDFKVKMGVNFHGYEMFQHLPDLKSKIKNQVLVSPVRKNMTKADFVFSYGGGITRLLEHIEIPQEKIVSINGAIDESWFDSREVIPVHKPMKLLFVGRFERRKGIEELNALLPSFLAKHNFKMEFAGPIPEESRISHPNVHYHGAISDVNQIKEIYAANDILIAPSYSEGMPNVIMEAMSKGLAILATDVGATSLLVAGDNGWMLPEMGLENLRMALDEIFNCTQDEIDLKKRKSKEKMNARFSWPEVAKKHIEFFSSLG